MFQHCQAQGKARLTDSASKGTMNLLETQFIAYTESEKTRSQRYQFSVAFAQDDSETREAG